MDRGKAVWMLCTALRVSSLSCAHAADETTTPEVVVESLGSRGDLAPDSVQNPYRVAPSSRAATQTFTAEDIAALKPRDVFDLLNQATVVLTMYQGRKVPFTLLIRGDSHFAFIVDGVYLPDQSAGRVINNLPLAAIEQIDVVRDSTALTLAPLVNFVNPSAGPNDGFIVIRTRRPATTGAAVQAAAESYDTYMGSVFAGVVSSGAYLAGLAAHYKTNGKPDYYMERDSAAEMIKGGAQAGGLRADVSLYHDRTNQQIQAALPSESTLWPQRWSFAPIDTEFGSANITQQWNPSQTTLFSVYQSEVNANLLRASVFNATPDLIVNKEVINGVDLKHTVQFGDTLLSFGAQYLYWDTPTGQMFYEGIPREEQIYGYFVYLERAFAQRQLVLDAAFRRDHHQVIRGVDRYAPVPVPGTLAVIEDQTLPASNYAAIGAAWKPVPQWILSGRAYHAREGGITDVASVDNMPLSPETQTKFEAATSLIKWPAFTPTVAVFNTRVQNLKTPVQYVTTNGVTTALYGQIDSTLSGVEFSANGWFASALGMTRYQLAWTHLAHTGPIIESGRSAPPNLANFGLQHLWDRWDFNLAVQYVDTFYSNWMSLDGKAHPIGDYTRLDVSLGYSFPMRRGGAKLSIYGRNVTDQHYETQLGFPDPGAVFGVEIAIDL